VDIGVILGVGVAFGMILAGNALEGGHLSSLWGLPAMMIVLGGTVGAVLVQFPLPIVKSALSSVTGLMKSPTHEPEKILEQIVDFAQRARKDGILALEKVAGEAHHPFLAKGILMAVDGSDSNAIRSTLEVVISQDEEHSENSAKVLEAAGGYCPTVGIIGAVLGLIHVMSNLSDINKVGRHRGRLRRHHLRRRVEQHLLLALGRPHQDAPPGRGPRDGAHALGRVGHSRGLEPEAGARAPGRIRGQSRQGWRGRRQRSQGLGLRTIT
jgi:chemotaxis protein MotA